MRSGTRGRTVEVDFPLDALLTIVLCILLLEAAIIVWCYSDKLDWKLYSRVLRGFKHTGLLVRTTIDSVRRRFRH